MSRTSTQSTVPRVSIVSAVDDHPVDLNLLFQAFNSQTLPADAYEVIMVDATHQVDCEAALIDFRAQTEVRANISCHRVASGGRARALNRALELATGDLVIFSGDDNLPSAGFVEAHLQFHQRHPEIEAVGIGPSFLPAGLRTPFSVWLEESGQLYGVPIRPDTTQIPPTFFYVANASVKRELLERVGPFDERFAHHAWDDYEFGQRLCEAGMRTYFVPAARTEHVHSIDLKDRERTMRHAGAAAKVYASNHSARGSWVKTVNTPAWRHWSRVAKSRVRLAATGSDQSLVRWWRARLDAALAAGYRNGG